MTSSLEGGRAGGIAPALLRPPALGEYTLLCGLAQGGMATIYVARKEGVAGFERLVAIKICHPHLREDEEFVSMFFDEARLAARIHHPNVVPTLDVHCAEDLYLVMDYVEGGSLADLLRLARRRGDLLPIGVVVRVMIDTLAGLHAAHELCDGDGAWMRLVHRDVSPHNVLVGVDGVGRITDFGIAFAAARSTVTQAGRLKGKLSYMSPEQVRGEPVTRRSDVFAAGTVLWEALTGRPLFRRGEEAATIHAVLVEEIRPPSSFARGVPAALDRVVMKALERDPEARHATAAEFADALERLPIARATAPEVAQCVETALGPAIRERRKVIRSASDAGSHRAPSAAPLLPPAMTSGDRGAQGRRPSEPSHGFGDDEITVRVDAGTLVMLANSTIPPAPVARPKDFELRQLRMVLAAAMLLLVGSAIGVLLTHSGTDSNAQPQPAKTAIPSESTR